MKLKKTITGIGWLALSLIVILTSMKVVEAEEKEITELEKQNIVQNCNSIKKSLETLRKNDSKIRVHYGYIFNRAMQDFMIPLNIALTRHNMATPMLTETQIETSKNRDIFNGQFVTYSQKLEELIAVDCTKQPVDFYNKLKITRSERIKLSVQTEVVNNLIKDYFLAIKELYEKLPKSESVNDETY